MTRAPVAAPSAVQKVSGLRLLDRLYRRAVIDAATGCWEWPAKGNRRGGHCQIRLPGPGRRMGYVHRVAYEHAVGPIPAGVCVLHRCDRPRCFNPEHLFLGTQGDNVRDCNAKGRARGTFKAGERNPMAKLTSAQAAEIRSRPWKRGCNALWAKEFGVSERVIWSVVNNEWWRAA